MFSRIFLLWYVIDGHRMHMANVCNIVIRNKALTLLKILQNQLKLFGRLPVL